MSSLKVLTDNNPILHKKSTAVAEITNEIKQLILDMAETMKKEQGIGLAAPQVGQNIRLVVINTENGPLALINPKILWRSLRKETEEEGCLSCPQVFVPVSRSKSVFVTALLENGKKRTFKAKGLFARVIQHEIDHLDGILITDKK